MSAVLDTDLERVGLGKLDNFRYILADSGKDMNPGRAIGGNLSSISSYLVVSRSVSLRTSCSSSFQALNSIQSWKAQIPLDLFFRWYELYFTFSASMPKPLLLQYSAHLRIQSVLLVRLSRPAWNEASSERSPCVYT